MKWGEFVAGLDDIRSSIRANKNFKGEVLLEDPVFEDLQALTRQAASVIYGNGENKAVRAIPKDERVVRVFVDEVDASALAKLPERNLEAGFAVVETEKEEGKKPKTSGPIVLPRDPNEAYKSKVPDVEEATEETVED